MLKYWRSLYRFLIFQAISYLTPLLFLFLSVMAITALNKLSSIARLNEAVGKNTAEMIELAGGFITGAVLTYLAVRFFGCQKERLEQRHARINAEDTRRREEEKTAVVFRCGKKDS